MDMNVHVLLNWPNLSPDPALVNGVASVVSLWLAGYGVKVSDYADKFGTFVGRAISFIGLAASFYFVMEFLFG